LSPWRALALALLLLPGPARAQALTKLPMLQTFRTSEARVQWETDANPAGTVHRLEWGLASPTQNSVVAQSTTQLAPDRFVHRAVATGLAPQTAYLYRVRSGPAVSATYSLRTAPLPATPFRAAWIADNQNQLGTPFLSVLVKLAPHAPDFIGHAGDTVQDGDVLAEWQSQWFDPFAAAPGNLGQTTPVLVARGNHDWEYPTSLAYHWLPDNGDWYAETIGRTRFLFLDSNLPWVEQESWLRAELASPASRNAAFRIAVFHIPAYTNLWDSEGYRGDAYVRDTWIPIFEQGKVDLVVNGHAHCYERGSLNGVTYTIVGGAGGSLDTIVQSPLWAFIGVAQSVHHYAIMDVSGDKLRWTAYDLQDHAIDSFELTSRAAGIPVFPSTRVR
jgi:Calcineurin-like phosphoesterase/Purple acid Phosphatase, N-terminal domain